MFNFFPFLGPSTTNIRLIVSKELSCDCQSKISLMRSRRDPLPLRAGMGTQIKTGLTSDTNSSITESPHPGAAQARAATATTEDTVGESNLSCN